MTVDILATNRVSLFPLHCNDPTRICKIWISALCNSFLPFLYPFYGHMFSSEIDIHRYSVFFLLSDRHRHHRLNTQSTSHCLNLHLSYAESSYTSSNLDLTRRRRNVCRHMTELQRNPLLTKGSCNQPH